MVSYFQKQKLNAFIFVRYDGDILKNEQAPFCIPCNELFTVKHFLITCAEFNYIRTKYFNVKTIKELFDNISTKKILDFLKEIRLFNKI